MRTCTWCLTSTTCCPVRCCWCPHPALQVLSHAAAHFCALPAECCYHSRALVALHAPPAAVITCLVARNLGAGDDHWAVRDEVSRLGESTVKARLQCALQASACRSLPAYVPACPSPAFPQAATLLAQVAQRSRERNDELSTALARVQQSLAAVLFDAAPQTQYGEHAAHGVCQALCAAPPT